MAELSTGSTKLVQYLNEAYGLEKRLETALQAHIAMTTKASYKKRLKEHLSETKRHGREVKQRIKALGGTAETVSTPGPEPIAEAAKAVFGAAPPDMSDLAKARGFPRPFPLFILDAVMAYQEQGPDYIVAILNGFTRPDDPNWNLYFPGHHIAMPKPLNDSAIKYTDGTPPTLANYSRDVAAFLFWAAEPKLEERKAMGFRVVIFLIIFAGLLYFTKKRIWSDVQGH